MKRYFRLYRQTFRLSLIYAMAYPNDFLTWAVVDIVWAVVNIGFFRILLFAIPEISGWTFTTLSLPLGILYFLNAVIWGLLWPNMIKIPRDVNKGDFDMFLTKPVNSQFLVSTRYISLNLLPSVVAGTLLLAYGLNVNRLRPETLLIIPISLVSASVISYAIWFITTTLVFWFNRLLNVANIFPHSVDIARYPVTIYQSPLIRFLFTFILPFALLGFLPAEVMLGRKSPLMLLLPIFLAAILLYLSHKFWNFSLRRYQSASS